MKKILTILLIIGACFLYNSYAENTNDEDTFLNKLQLANITRDVLKLNVNLDALNEDDAYSKVAQAINARLNLSDFDWASKGNSVTYAEIADIAYGIVGGSEKIDKYAKLKFLIERGYVTAHDADSFITIMDARNILYNSLAVVEPYTETENRAAISPNITGPIAELPQKQDEPAASPI